MKVPLNWLREYCSPQLDTAAIEERLTMTGTKVETILHHGVPSPEHFVVGRVLTVAPHPKADRLRVCEVEVGEDAPVTIVCGAPNVAAAQTVAVALPGATMPDGTRIKATKLRGVPSNGMILSAEELEIDSDHEGIMVLDELIVDADRSEIDTPFGARGGISDRPAPGMALADVLAISTDVLELEITPNRPDCLGVYGVARELHAATGAQLAPEPWADDPGSEGPLSSADGGQHGEGQPSDTDGGQGREEHPSGADAGQDGEGLVVSNEDPSRAHEGRAAAQVTVSCPDLCKRFTARVFEDVKIASSPPWLAARLSAAGQRPINNVVDITNYVMLLTAQPLHAFDLDRVAGGRLTVRRAHEGEQLTTLDGQVRTLDGEMVVIEDAQGPTSIAGIMGGERSEVKPGTKRVLMEVASWSGPNIHRTSWALGLRSEASGRFEKGLAPELCMQAQALATRLMIELCGATVAPGTIDLAWERAPAQRIRLRERRVEAILGMPVARARQAEILQALDFEVAENNGEPSSGGDLASAGVQGVSASGAPVRADTALEVSVPAVRRDDVTREADLIEEIARIHGLAQLPATLPARRGAYGRLSPVQRLRRRAVDALVGRGLYEVVGWTFTPPTLHDRLRLAADDPRRRAPVLENPLSEDQSLLRTTLLGSLLDVASHNSARGMSDLRIFEMGTLFALEREARAPDDGAGAVEHAGGPGSTGVREQRALGVLLSGAVAPATWGAPDPPQADLFAAKGILEALGAALRVKLECVAGGQPFLHPGRAATVVCGGEQLGWLGELHPLVAREWDMDGASVIELELDRLLELACVERSYRDVISFPELRQDLAVVLAEHVPAQRVLDAVGEAAGELLDHVGVFDVYSGPQVGEGRRSLALSLAFRAPDRTLTDEDVAPVRARIVAALGELGGELRG
jgi:phenylalanyl-tRNA synthetase beta chain